jgi:hypothetical protein
MKTVFYKTLFAFTSITLIFFSSKAQIVYTDVTPDSTIFSPTGSYSLSLDLNNDGTSDFKFTVTSGISHCSPEGNGHQSSANVTPLSGSKTANSGGLPSALQESEIIDSLLTWSSGSNEVLKSKQSGSFCFGSSGKWPSFNDRYLGLKISSGGNVYYGWARLSVYADGFSSSITIKDYAYNSIPNQSILAGQTCPPQSLIIANGPTTFCLGDSVTLTSANSGTNLSYKWKLNGSNISGATNKNYTAKVAGKYKLKVTDNTNACTSTSAVVTVKVPCKVMNENLADEDDVLRVYPNPSSTPCVISFSILQTSNVSLKIFDVEGRLIRTLANEPMSAGTHEITWDAHDANGNEASAGIYLLKLQTPGEIETVRLSLVK